MKPSPYADWDRRHVWHPYTRASAAAGDLPLIVRGAGIHLFDEQGRRYVDAISSWWCAALGHGHPRVVGAIQRQAAVLQHSILGNLAHPAAAELAQRLAGLMPTPDRHTLFASDGASAVEQALKIAVQYAHQTGHPERRRFACLRDAYHGDTFGAMSMGYLDHFHAPFRSLLLEADRLPLPDGPGIDEALAILDRHAAEYAAVIVEPLCLGAGGMRMYPPAGLRRLAEWCRARGVLLVDDEIAMGFGRTGRMFAFEHAGVDPDIVCLGKALAAGYLPLSATVVRDDVYRSFDDDHTLQHGHTFCGNPIAAAAAVEALRLYVESDLPARAARLGARLAEHLSPLRAERGVRDVRCLGLLGVVELEPEAPSAHTRAHRIRLALQDDGVLLRPLGPVVYVMPPLVITEGELDDLCVRFCGAIRRTT